MRYTFTIIKIKKEIYNQNPGTDYPYVYIFLIRLQYPKI